MTSYQDNVPFIPSSPKLPSISQPSGIYGSNGNALRTWHPGGQWNGPLRKKIDYAITYSGQPHHEDIEELSKDLTKLMISALQPNAKKETWLELNHALALIQPYNEFLRISAMAHYAERIYHYYNSNMERLFDVPVIENLANVFPHTISDLRGKQGSGINSTRFKKIPGMSQSPAVTLKSRQPEPCLVERSLTLPNGNNPYSLLRTGEDPANFIKPKPLYLSNISKCIGNVALETITRESGWKETQNMTVAAIDVDFPAMFENTVEDAVSSSVSNEEDMQESAKELKQHKQKEECLSISGRQAVELFLKHKHMHRVKFIYFNLIKNRHYRPYDLISVPRECIDPEHFIFSSFGVLHIFPDGHHSETFTLAEWNKNAVLWTAINGIPFFRNYLITKAFRRWHANVKWRKYDKIRREIKDNLLHAVPEFGSALLHIFRLINELSEIQFLPVKPIQQFQYGIGDLEADIHRLKLDAQNVLELFFRYAKKVVDTTKQACFEQLKYYERQAKHTKPLFSKESLYVQRRKRLARDKNLVQARKVTSQLPSFVTLVDQAISVHLIALARIAITEFVSSVLSVEDEDEDEDVADETSSLVASSHTTVKETNSSKVDDIEVMTSVFVTKFVFDRKTHCLEMQPSLEKFKSVMTAAIEDILEVMCNGVFSMHSFSAMNIPERPRSAPPSIGSSGSSREPDISDQSSVTSFDSDLQSVKSSSSIQPNIEKGMQMQTNSLENASLDPENLQLITDTGIGLTSPDVLPCGKPTKNENKDGVKTPDLVKAPSNGTLGLMVGGQAIMGQFSPIDQTKLKEKMLQDAEIAAAIAKQTEMVKIAVSEVNDFCKEYAWLNDIRKFTSTWNELELEKWKGRSARQLEDQLNLIKHWIEKIKNMDRALLTSNKLLFVQCTQPNVVLVPALNAIFKKLITMAVTHAKQLSENVTQEIKEALKVLNVKETNMKSFSAYARKVTESIKHKDQMANTVSYVRSLYEVVKMTYRQLTQEEEKLDERVKSSWEAFLFQLKDATSFVNNQKPIVLKQIDEVFQVHYSKALSVAEQASSGDIMDPKSDCKEMLDLIGQYIVEFQDVYSKLAEFSRFHESVCGEPYPLQDLHMHAQQMNMRRDLLKCIHVSRYTMDDWKATMFRKFNAENAMNKISEWKQLSEVYKENLSNDDAVLTTWIQTLDKFLQELPLLHRLSRDAMKTRHWKEIFTGMGQSYEQGWAFTVEELLTYKPSSHADLINQVYQNASAEYALEQTIRKIKNQWENRQFQLAKHIYMVKAPATDDYEPDDGQVKSQATSKYMRRKFMSRRKSKLVPQGKDSETYILVGVEDLLKDLSESHVRLQSMLQSHHAAEVKADAEIWSDTLQQIVEIITLWVSCQGKWMYLNKVLRGEPNLVEKFQNEALRFEIVDKKYRVFIQTMLQDPKVLSVLSRRHGQQGWRELQGENLRKHLLSCIKDEEEILHDISSLLSVFRSEFPRMYFLCDDDCIQLLGISQQPKALVPFVKKCFKGVQSLVFSLPRSVNGRLHHTTSSLDLELHSHRLEVTHLIGSRKEHLPITPLVAHSDATMWFKSLEHSIKSAISNQIKQAIEDRMRNVSCVSDVLDEILELEVRHQELASQNFRHWMLKYTGQVVLITDAILWYRDIWKMLKNGGKKVDYENAKKSTIHKYKQLSQTLQHNASHCEKSILRMRLQSLLSSLITQTAYYKDILKSLEMSSVASPKAYEWQRILKLSAEIVDYSNVGVEKKQSYVKREAYDLSSVTSVGGCYVEHISYKEPFGYEYASFANDNNKIGVCTGTVITPVTERCMLDLALSMRLGQCGGLFGPVGVGKSTVISELSKVFGRQLINITCCEELPINVMKRCLCGMVETGAWLCFQQAERLPASSLSILSQHIKEIQQTYKTIENSYNSQYSIHGRDGNNFLKRSNSVTTLHKSTPKSTWQPQVSETYVDSLKRFSFEDYEADKYLSDSTDQPIMDQIMGSMIFDGHLLQARRGFSVFLTFAAYESRFPNVPDNLRLSYRPTCFFKPDVRKLIEVWLQAAGFCDFINLSVKLYKMYEVINSNADVVSIDGKGKSPQASSAVMAQVNLATLKLIILIGLSNCVKLRSQQRSRAESVSDSDGSIVSRAPSATSSTTSISRSSRRSEVILANHNEEVAIVDAILAILPSKLPSTYSVTRLKENLRSVFPLSARPIVSSDAHQQLANAVQKQMVVDGLHPSSEFVEKALQLYTSLNQSKAVVIAGLAGSGKTTLYRILSKALNSLNSQIEGSSSFTDISLSSTTLATQVIHSSNSHFSTFGIQGKSSRDLHSNQSTYSVDITNVFPNAYRAPELFGFYESKTNLWKQGLLVKLLKECTIIHKVGKKNNTKPKGAPSETLQSSDRSFEITTDNPVSRLHKWLVLDGEILPAWVDNIRTLLDGHHRSRMCDMDEVIIPKTTHILFETADVASASPAVLSQCAVIHCNLYENWRNIASSWLDNAYGKFAVARKSVRMWKELIEDLVPSTLNFLSQHKSSVLEHGIPHAYKEKGLTAMGVREISSFLSIFTACLTSRHMTRDYLGHTKEDDDVTIDKRQSHSASGSPDDNQSTPTRGSSARSGLDDAIPDSYHQTSLNLFGFAFVWAFGGNLLENEMPMFDDFVRDAFRKARHTLSFPVYETVYDYFVDDEFSRFTLWEDKIDLRPRGVMNDGTSYTPLHQMEKYAYLSRILLQSQKSVLLAGETGCGKTSLVNNMLQTELGLTKISLSPGLSASLFQKLLETKASPTIKQHNLGLMAHPNAIIASRTLEKHQALFFLDDLSCAGAIVDKSHGQNRIVQPTLELLRQVICLNGTYDHERLIFKSMEQDMAFIAACGLPSELGSGLGHRQHLTSPRLTRRFVTLHFLKPTKESILSIYHDAVQSWLEEFPAYSLARHYDLSQAIISGAFDLYTMIKSYLKPSPRNPHYIFSLHDLSQIMQGLFLLTPRTRGRPIPMRKRGAGGTEPPKRPGGGRQVGRFRANRGWGDVSVGSVPPMMRTVVRLWLHECMRTFHDRLVDDNDRKWLSHTLFDVLKNHFCSGKDERPTSPAIERVRIVKTPIPSGGATPIPRMLSSSGTSESLQIQDDDTDNLQESLSEYDTSTIQQTDNELEETDSEISIRSQIPVESFSSDVQKATSFEVISNNSTSSPSQQSSALFSYSNISDQSQSILSNTVKGLPEPLSTPSTKESVLQDDYKSETATVALDEDTTTSEDYESRANTAFTEDDTQSAVTGYTTELESVFQSETTIEDSTETESSISVKLNLDEKKTPAVGFRDQSVHPSVGIDESQNTSKPTRAQHGGGKPSRPGGAKLGVTFMPGLIDDTDVATNVTGPLIPLDQVLHYNEEMQSILFSRGLLSAALGKYTDPYAESTEGQLAEALKQGLQEFNRNASETEHMNLVFFGQAVRHAARLSRILYMKSSGHALLLSSARFTGRQSLIKLVTYLNNVKVYTTSSMHTGDADKETSYQSQLRQIIKDASFQAGVYEKKVALVLHDDISSDPQCIDDVCAVIREGRCPALYSQKELATIVTAFAPPSSKAAISAEGGRMTSLEKLDQQLEEYFAKVIQNFHVIILATYPDLEGPHDFSILQRERTDRVVFHNNDRIQSFYQFLKRYPDLLTRFSCIDLYRGWDHSSWQMVAEHFITESFDMERDHIATNSGPYHTIPWSMDTSPDLQLNRLCYFLAYVHCDAMSRTSASLGHGADLILNPVTVKQTAQLFISIVKMVKSEQMKIIKRYEQALRKIREAENSLRDFRDDREGLIQHLEDARQTERSWKQHVEAERQEYAEARERCTIEEENIETLEAELDLLKQETDVAFDAVNPMYAAALEAVNSISPKCIDEIKRYQNPPASAVTVVTCLCHMFEVLPANWENGKALISQDKFFEDLQFYDKDHIPENIFQKMKHFVKAPAFQVAHVKKGSMAASMVCRWVHAIYCYAKALRYLEPKIEAQREAESKLKTAQATLGSKRVRCNQIKEELDSKIQKHKNASLLVKQYEKRLRTLEDMINKAQILMNNMNDHINDWREEKGKAQSFLESAVGDSAVTAACVAYYGLLGNEQRDLALKHWMKIIKTGYIDAETQTLEILSESEKANTNRHSGVGSASTESKTETDSIWNDDVEEDYSSSNSTHGVKTRGLLKVRDNLTMRDILSSRSEQRNWHRKNMLRNQHARQNAMRIHALALHQDISWCLIHDPDNQAEVWLKIIFENLRRDMEISEFVSDSATSFEQSRPSTTATSQADSLGIIEDVGDESSLSSDHENEMETESLTETEVTITVSASTTSVVEKVVSRTSTRESKVRFEDDAGDEEKSNKEILVENEEESVQESAPESIPETPLSFPLDQLWICKSDDPQLSSLLKSAAFNGAMVLVKNLEQALSQKTPLFEKDSLKNYLNISTLHPNFRLFLSTSLPVQSVLLAGTNKYYMMPLNKLAVTDMALDLSALEEKLEQIVLRQERSDFEAQKRLVEADIFHLEEQLGQLQNNLLLKVANAEKELLSDDDILPAFQTCKRNSLTTTGSLKETLAMEVKLMKKKTDLSQVAQHGRLLYRALEQASLLNQCLYHTTASHFIAMFSTCVKSRLRGSRNISSGSAGGTGGALQKSRVIELNQSFTEHVLTVLSRKFPHEDLLVFISILSVEKMVLDGKITNDERNELLGFDNDASAKYGKHIHHANLSKLVKPLWISDAVWNDVISLEQRHSKVFAGLCYSMSTKPNRWQEYLDNPPVLLSHAPCNKLHGLTLGQKALLWKTIKPELFSKILEDLNSSILGGVANKPNIFDFDETFSLLNHRCPCVLLLPPVPTESCFLPSHHLLSAAKQKGIQVVERSAPFDDNLGEVLEECMTQGRWLVLNDCHLSSQWPKKFLELLTTLTTIVDSTVESDETVLHQSESALRSISTTTDESVKLENKVTPAVSVSAEGLNLSSLVCDQKFRLWLVTRRHDDINRALPKILVEHAEFLVLETPYIHRDLVKKTYNTLIAAAADQKTVPSSNAFSVKHMTLNHVEVPYNVRAALTYRNGLTEEQKRLLMQLSMLHGILLERSHFGKSSLAKSCSWTDGEIVDALGVLMLTKDENVSQRLCSSVPMRHISEPRDLEILKEIVHQCIFLDTKGSHSDLVAEITTLIRHSDDLNHVFNYLLQKPGLKSLGLHTSAENAITQTFSKKLASKLQAISTFKLLQAGEICSNTDSRLVISAHEVQVKRILENLLVQVKESAKPKLNNKILSPVMMGFYSAEVERFNMIYHILQSDLTLCLSVIKRENESAIDVMSILECISHDQIPKLWHQSYPDLLCFCDTVTFSKLINDLDQRVTLLSKYMNMATGSTTAIDSEFQTDKKLSESSLGSKRVSSATQTLSTYNLAVFIRPDIFLQSILFAVARAGHQDFNKYAFSMEFVPAVCSKAFNPSRQDLPPNIPYATIYIEGLYLHKAVFDKKSGMLLETRSKKPHPLPMLRVVTERKSITRITQKNLSPETKVEKPTSYKCPVTTYRVNNCDMCSANTVITNIPIPTENFEFCVLSGVNITCSL
ncbi:dynein heavy chain domain-containing protein 1-like [Clavelina lepadiformis]|uniref:dynein heavy chain domain-containing protein 1-like n=1 Tax=Clavelina lepadiformis TaxID=159417 RepID=UPI0040418BE1